MNAVGLKKVYRKIRWAIISNMVTYNDMDRIDFHVKNSLFQMYFFNFSGQTYIYIYIYIYILELYHKSVYLSNISPKSRVNNSTRS